MSTRRTPNNLLLGKINKLASGCRSPDMRFTITINRVRVAFVCEEVKPGSHKLHLVTQHLHEAVETGQLRPGRSSLFRVAAQPASRPLTCEAAGLGYRRCPLRGTSSAKLKLLHRSRCQHRDRTEFLRCAVVVRPT